MPIAMPDHVPVLLSEVLTGLHLTANDTVIDATLGGGGHARALLEAIAPSGTLFGIEADERTLNETKQSLHGYGQRFVPLHGNFRDLEAIAAATKIHTVQGILFDLGVSSMTIGDPKRGFSFQADGPLDMRFDQTTQTTTAADLVNTSSASELVTLFRTFGEEPVAERIAKQIVTERQRQPYTTTLQLATSIEAVKHRRGRIHPATNVFQALRIAVNDEYGAITSALPAALNLLAPNGHLAVITFHSGEDRIVKQWMKGLEAAIATMLTKHVIAPTRHEQLSNPRSRSAKLRILQKK